MHAKLGIVALLACFHLVCGRFIRDFAAGRNQRSHVYYRVFNELPVLALFGAVILVVVRPF
jgi:putative membrane protein